MATATASATSGSTRKKSVVTWKEEKVELKPMVAWFSPATLAKAFVRAVLTATIGQYADRRDTQRELNPSKGYEGSKNIDDLWIDFVADTGDGFRSTFTVARVMAEDKLSLGGEKTFGANVILFGGDQVYPDPSNEAYLHRFVRPFQQAFLARKCRPKPEAYAIPGNHDWYDGLNEFISLFCREKEETIEGITTPQRCSYWALPLVDDWWCLGVDCHVGASINLAQIEYFEKIVKEEMKEKSKIILIYPKPVWIEYFLGERSGYHELRDFMMRIENSLFGHEVHLILTGDLHCYARYELERQSKPPCQLVMSGGGGAYLYPTHGLPRVGLCSVDQSCLPVGDDKDSVTESIKVEKVYPKPSTSTLQAIGSLLLSLWNPALAFLLLGPIYLFLNYIVLPSGAPGTENDLWVWAVWEQAPSEGIVPTVLWPFWNALKELPILAITLLILFGTARWAIASAAATDRNGRLSRFIRFNGLIATSLGILHGSAHIFFALFSVWLVASLRNKLPGWDLYFFKLPDWSLSKFDLVFVVLVIVAVVVFSGRISRKMLMTILSIQIPLSTLIVLQILVEEGARFVPIWVTDMTLVDIAVRSEQIIVVGGILGTTLVGSYLWFANLFGGHSNDVLACQSIAKYKNFVRLHIKKDVAEAFSIGIGDPPKQNEWIKDAQKGHDLPNGRVKELAKIIDRFPIRKPTSPTNSQLLPRTELDPSKG